MKVIILGAPGSGKGTQAEYIVNALQIPKISTGDMLRAAVTANTPLGQEVKAVMAAGKLVTDQIILSLIQQRIAAKDCQAGFLFDGFPRTIAQAEQLLQAGIDVDYIVNIEVPDTVIIQRLTGRLVHINSGRIYHTKFNPPKVAGIDDDTGEPLIQRADDKEAVVLERLKIYHQQTEPLTTWYQSENYLGTAKYVHIDGLNEAKVIATQILQHLK